MFDPARGTDDGPVPHHAFQAARAERVQARQHARLSCVLVILITADVTVQILFLEICEFVHE